MRCPRTDRRGTDRGFSSSFPHSSPDCAEFRTPDQRGPEKGFSDGTDALPERNHFPNYNRSHFKSTGWKRIETEKRPGKTRIRKWKNPPRNGCEGFHGCRQNRIPSSLGNRLRGAVFRYRSAESAADPSGCLYPEHLPFVYHAAGSGVCDLQIRSNPSGYSFRLEIPAETGALLGFDVKIDDAAGNSLRETTLGSGKKLFRNRCQFSLAGERKNQ